MSEQANTNSVNDGPHFEFIRDYLKDVSFETPNSPAIFKEDTQPELNLQLQSSITELEESIYEVVLHVTVTATQGDKTSFLVEVQQAGIFMMKGFDAAHTASMLGAYCPNALFPFAREEISHLVVKGGFPPLLLKPINFDALYAQQLEKAGKQAASAE